MANTEEIIVKFRTEGGQEVEETFRRAADAGDQFHAKVSKAGSALGDLQLKSEARVARNIGNITQAMTSGGNAADVLAKSIGAVSESFKGSLLYAGGAAVGLALYEGITKAGEAVIQFHSELADLRRESLVSGDFMGTERINQNLDNTLGKLRDVQFTIKSANQLAGGEQSKFGFLQPFGAVVRGISSFLTGKGEGEEKELKADALKFLDQLGQKQSRVNEIAKETLSGDERRAALLKIESDSLERQEAISSRAAKAGLSREATNRLIQKDKDYTAELTAEANKQYDIEKIQLDLQRDIVATERNFGDTVVTSVSILDQKAKALDKVLKLQLTVQEREKAQTQRDQTQYQREQAGRSTFAGGPYAFANRAFNQQVQEATYRNFDLRFQQEEVRRRLGGADIRNPFQRAYEEAAFPYQRPLTQQEQTAAYYAQQKQRTADYYQDIANRWNNYNDLVGQKSAMQFQPGQGIAPNTNVNTGQQLMQEYVTKIDTLIETLIGLPQKVGVN